MNKTAQEIQILPDAPEGAHFLGSGRLSWCRHERIGDRYGTVGLWAGESLVALDVDSLPERGRLLARVTDLRESDHIGDLFHGLFPGGAQLGEVVVLSPEPGVIHVPGPEDGTAGAEVRGQKIGVRPDDGRDHFWLAVLALYRLIDQEVDLYVEAER